MTLKYILERIQSARRNLAKQERVNIDNVYNRDFGLSEARETLKHLQKMIKQEMGK